MINVYYHSRVAKKVDDSVVLTQLQIAFLRKCDK